MTYPFFTEHREEDVAWMDDGACQGMDLEPFYPTHRAHTDRGKNICKSCDVRARCLEYALTHREWGVWGGTDDNDRDRLRRRLGNRRTA